MTKPPIGAMDRSRYETLAAAQEGCDKREVIVRIGTRITAGFGSMALLLILIGGLGWTLASQQISSTSSQRLTLQLTHDCKQYQLDAAGVAVAANSIAYDFTSHSDPSSDLQSFAQSSSAAQADGAELAPLLAEATERQELAQAGLALNAYISQTNTIVADFRAGTPSALRAANDGVAGLAYHTVTTPLGQLEQRIDGRSQSALAVAAARDSWDRVLVVALMLSALALAAVIGTVVGRSITTRLRRTADVLELVAGGDMTKRIDVDSSDEVGQMGVALNLALDRVDEPARGQRFESRLGNALDMAGSEAEVLVVVERSFGSTVPASAIELLLADNSHAHLKRMAAASPSGSSPGCSVDSPDNCPAARRAQVQHFPDSEALDSCPKLIGRSDGPCQAVCVPVSIMGRTVGVMHATRPVGDPFPSTEVSDLETLAKLAGTRIGLLRIMSETQLQAATDGLTGLLNRRSFEQAVDALLAGGASMTLGDG